MTRTDVTTKRPQQGGPPLGVVGLAATGLTVGGIAVSSALGGPLVSPFGDRSAVVAFFAAESDAVLVSGLFALGASVPLAVYTASATARLRQLGVVAAGPAIAQVGGTLAAGLLALSGLVQVVLARPGVVAPDASPLVLALHQLVFLTGGVGTVLFLGLLIAGVAVPGLLLGLLPRPLAVTGIVIAAVAELSFLSVLVPGLSVLLPLARFPGLVWLVVAGFVLPVSRRPRPE